MNSKKLTLMLCATSLACCVHAGRFSFKRKSIDTQETQEASDGETEYRGELISTKSIRKYRERQEERRSTGELASVTEQEGEYNTLMDDLLEEARTANARLSVMNGEPKEKQKPKPVPKRSSSDSSRFRSALVRRKYEEAQRRRSLTQRVAQSSSALDDAAGAFLKTTRRNSSVRSKKPKRKSYGTGGSSSPAPTSIQTLSHDEERAELLAGTGSATDGNVGVPGSSQQEEKQQKLCCTLL